MPADYTIQLRRGTAAQWTSANPVLKQGELGYETDTKLAKLGDGTTAWTSLAYWNVGGGGGSVVSVFGRAGAVTAQSGDYTAAQVGADAAGTSAAETTRAEAAEALLAPKASPTFTGTPIAPTATPLTNTTQVATTAYADAAVAVEKSRAQTAEGLLAPLASPALTGAPTAPTQTAGDNSTKVATTAYVATAIAAEVDNTIDGVTVSGAASAGNVITATGPTTAIWQTPAGGVTLDTTAADIAASPATQAAGSVGKAADAGHVHPQPPMLAPTGLTGATAVASRYVGAVSGAAPSSGTFALGDFVIDQTGAIRVCTTAGSPGTWTLLPHLDGNTADIQPSPGTATSGNSGQATNSNHVHGQPTMFAPTGLTGAVSASRYVGATASGSPSSGTFAVGDYVVAQTGDFYLCTAAGTPGTWLHIGHLNNSAAQSQPLGTQASGSSGVAAQADHVHPPTGVLQSANNLSDVANTGTALSTLGGLPKAGGTMTGAFIESVVALTWGATVPVNAALGNHFRLTLAGATAQISAPTNAVDGQKIMFEIIQASGGGDALTWATGSGGFEFGPNINSGSAPTITTTASKRDFIGFVYIAAVTTWICIGLVQGN